MPRATRTNIIASARVNDKGTISRAADRLRKWWLIERLALRSFHSGPATGAKLKDRFLGSGERVPALQADDVSVAVVSLGEQIPAAARARFQVDHSCIPPGRVGGRPKSPIPARASFSRRRASDPASMH